jgi:hypothetical protein
MRDRDQGGAYGFNFRPAPEIVKENLSPDKDFYHPVVDRFELLDI